MTTTGFPASSGSDSSTLLTSCFDDGRNGGDDLAEFELIKDRRLTGGIETDHENAHLSLGKQLLKKLGECEPHFCKIS